MTETCSSQRASEKQEELSERSKTSQYNQKQLTGCRDELRDEWDELQVKTGQTERGQGEYQPALSGVIPHYTESFIAKDSLK